MERTKRMNRHKCDTVEQFYVYEWIKNSFHFNYITLQNINRYTIKLTDGNDYALITYYNGMIVFQSSAKYHYKIDIFSLKKP